MRVDTELSIRVIRTDLHVLNMRTRMPFKYGIATMTALPHLFLRVELEVDGVRKYGIAADHLPPKWFTKDPASPIKDDITDMLTVIRSACVIAEAAGVKNTIFQLWQRIYTVQQSWVEETRQKFPPLLWNFGVSLVERAIIDAFCRITKTPFAVAVRDNTLGIRIGAIHPELSAFIPAKLLPTPPKRHIAVRHTVGLADPLSEEDVNPLQRVQDGLPQSLLGCIRTYGINRFKIKLCGDREKDLARLRDINAVIGRSGIPDFAFTIDGNESFLLVSEFRIFWEEIQKDNALKDFIRHLIFVEQPFHRSAALSSQLRDDLLAWKERPPIIIDESDSSLDSLPTALSCGYAGTSHKNCKGVMRGIANACLIAYRNQKLESDKVAASFVPGGKYILSGEDLCNIGPVALLQDLAVMSLLGVEHVERNGHHYFAGLGMLPEAMQVEVLGAHGDLYHTSGRGFATLKIENGTIDVSSTMNAPFGYGFNFDPTIFTPLSEWTYESLASV